MFEIGSRVVYQKDDKIAGVVKRIHTERPFHRIICVVLDSGTTTWFTPAELATEDDLDEYREWLLSNNVPYPHELAYVVLDTDLESMSADDYANSVNYSLSLYLGLATKEEV